jgi:hypothetical protein
MSINDKEIQKSYGNLPLSEGPAGLWAIVQSGNTLEIKVPVEYGRNLLALAVVTSLIMFLVLFSLKTSPWLMTLAVVGNLMIGLTISGFTYQMASKKAWLIVDRAAGKLSLPFLKKEYLLATCRFQTRQQWENTGDSISPVSTLFLVTDHDTYIVLRSYGNKPIVKAQRELETFILTPLTDVS